MSKKRFRHFVVIHENKKDNVKDNTVPENAMRCVLSIKDILKSYARTAAAVAVAATTTTRIVTAETILREKARKFKIILNTRWDDAIPVSEAVEEMARHNVGSVLIVDDEHHVKGIFTERDYLCRVVAKSLDPTQVMLQDVCSRDVFCVSLSVPLDRCVELCAYKPFRHFPVVDEESNSILGILSIKDIVKAISKGHDASPGFWLMEFFRSKMERKRMKASNVVVEPNSAVVASTTTTSTTSTTTTTSESPDIVVDVEASTSNTNQANNARTSNS